MKLLNRGKRNEAVKTYLALDGCPLLFITIGGGNLASSNTDSTISGLDTSSFGKIFFSFLSSDFDLLLFAAATELVWFELMFGLELGTAMLWDVTIRHGCWASEAVTQSLVCRSLDKDRNLQSQLKGK